MKIKLVASSLLSTALLGCAVSSAPVTTDHAGAPSSQPVHAGHSHERRDSFAVLSSVVTGNQHFMSASAIHPHQDIQRRKTLAGGQQPGAIVLSCSDSRVPPELIFDQGLGDLFVVRSAGEIADKVAVASIEYAVEHLGSSLIVVLGHESCGAVKAALNTPEGKSAGSENLDHLVNAIKPHIKDAAPAPHDKQLYVPVRANVDGVADDLMRQSEIISHGVSSGKVRIVRGIYRLESGKVDFWH